jgi:hypothetical protein
MQKSALERRWIGGRLDASVAQQFAELAAARRRTVSAELELALEEHVERARAPRGRRRA